MSTWVPTAGWTVSELWAHAPTDWNDATTWINSEPWPGAPSGDGDLEPPAPKESIAEMIKFLVDWDKTGFSGIPVAPPTQINYVTVDFSVTTSPKTSPTFDVVNGDLVVIRGYTGGSTKTLGLPTWTGTGTVAPGPTAIGVVGWTNVYSWTIPVTATATGRTVTVTRTAGVADQWGFDVAVIRNHNGIGHTGSARDLGAPLLDLAAGAHSLVIMGTSDWNVRDGADRAWRAEITEDGYYFATPEITVYSGRIPDTSTGGIQHLGLLAPSDQKWAMIGIEVLGEEGPVNFRDDVTSRIRSRIDSVSLTYGRDQSTALAPITSGRGSITLDNRSRDYSPRNTQSPLYGKIKPARNVLVTRSIEANTYTLFRGHTDDNPINPNLDNKTVQISLVDSLADLRGQNISTELYSGLRTGEAIGKVLDAVGWPTTERDLDPGATIIPWYWEDNTDALEAIEKIVQSEGAPALVTIDPDGKIMFMDRHHRTTHTRSTTSQATFRGSQTSGSPYFAVPFIYDEAWRNIINSAIVNIDIRAPQELQVISESEGKIVLTALEQKLITVSSGDPFFNAQVPAVNTDYKLLAGAATFQLTRTSGASTTIKITAGGSGAIIEGLALRAQPVTVINTVQIQAGDVESIAEYGARSFPTELPWCNPTDADAVVEAAVALRADPLPILTASFVVSRTMPALAEMILARDISDRVTVYENETSLQGVDFYIESISHEFSDEYDHRVIFGLEMVPNEGVSPVFRFDIAGAGFDDGKFGSGVNDPGLTFQFDSTVSGHRFNEGVFAT